jgi:hypothetical protein
MLLLPHRKILAGIQVLASRFVLPHHGWAGEPAQIAVSGNIAFGWSPEQKRRKGLRRLRAFGEFGFVGTYPGAKSDGIVGEECHEPVSHPDVPGGRGERAFGGSEGEEVLGGVLSKYRNREKNEDEQRSHGGSEV